MGDKNRVGIELLEMPSPGFINFNFLIDSQESIDQGSFYFGNVRLRDIRRFVDSFYDNTQEQFKSNENNMVNFGLISFPETGDIRIFSSPGDMYIQFDRNTSELIIEKFSRLLRDQKDRI
jgi:hypothetical protein